MIDLHMHTHYSDGSENCVTVLNKCQEKNLDYISITDHNTAEAYNELENLDISKHFNGKIIPGIELNTNPKSFQILEPSKSQSSGRVYWNPKTVYDISQTKAEQQNNIRE